jgi:2,3-bisphosphoglycerate-dependent phosphoglycerate mutase
MSTLVLLRHGQSVWNRDKRFAGWSDVELSARGVEQARKAGELLRAKGYEPDVCFTSFLRRAAETLRIVLKVMRLEHVPVHRSWRLNERHYGALQGLAHREAHRRFGTRSVLAWQRQFGARPPLVEVGDERFPGNDPAYAAIDPGALPRGESLEDTTARLLPCWKEEIAPEIRRGRRVFIVAHGNSLRALIAHLEQIAPARVPVLHVPTGQPLVYEMDGDARPLRRFYLRRGPRVLQWAVAAWR